MPPNSSEADERSHHLDGTELEIDKFFTNSPQAVPEFNPFTLHFIDQELLDHKPTGSTVPDENSVIGESGRLYHGYKQGSYLLPNDAAEQDRLDLQHQMLLLLLDGRLGLAPLAEAPRLVLDVATGTGIWALEFARANPTSFVIGTDLSKIQPVPDVTNCLFERDDCEDEWLWTHKFDYIHIRGIAAAIRDPQRLFKQAFDSLAPGGWLEIQDGQMILQGDDERVVTSNLRRFFELMRTGLALHGIDTLKARHYNQWMSEAGFCNIREETFNTPTSPWPRERKAKRVGEYFQADLLSGLGGVSFQVLRSLGMQPDEIEPFIVATKNELKNDRIRSYLPGIVLYGQKPLIKEEPIKEEQATQGAKVEPTALEVADGYYGHDA